MSGILVVRTPAHFLLFCAMAPQFALTALRADVVTLMAFVRTPSGDVQMIGPPGVNSTALAVNDSGQVLVETNFNDRAYLWTPGAGLTDIGSLGGPSTIASALNNNGQVIGVSLTASGDSHAFVWSSNTGMIDVTGVLGSDALPFGINSLGHVTGSLNSAGGSAQAQPFLWTPPVVQAIDQFSGHVTDGFGINDADQITADSFYSANGASVSRGLIWSSSIGYIDLGTLGGSSSIAYAINNSGQVVGWSRTATGRQDAYIWDPVNGMQDLGILPGTTRSIAESLNGLGEVVGTAGTELSFQSRAFLWTPTSGMQDLGIAGVAWSINNSGEIVGAEYVPEPSTLALMAIGSICIVIVRYKLAQPRDR